MEALRTKLRIFSHKSYKLYKGLEGEYDFKTYKLSFDKIQSDPFAQPSHLTIKISLAETRFPGELFAGARSFTAFSDALTRVIAKNIRRMTKRRRGTGNSGFFAIQHGTQKMLARNTVIKRKNQLEIRFLAGLPAYGRTIAGEQAEEMFFSEVPALVAESLYWEKLDKRYFHSFVNLLHKQEHIRAQLKERGLLAFLANGSNLARQAGDLDTPLGGAVNFHSPPALEVTMTMPDGGALKGMGIHEGITLITGGGFHGKSTLLNAVQAGIYNHIPGDGREYVISRRDLVKVRAEDSRSVKGIDISPFINNLPGGKDTENFNTDNASGSTSQAANIAEALETGTSCLLMDEDTSSANFLIRDRRMQALIPAAQEPITPYLDLAEQLFAQKQVSTVMVMGGSGDYLDIASTVILMDNYRAVDKTVEARKIAVRFPLETERTAIRPFKAGERIIENTGFDPSRGKREEQVSAAESHIIFGKHKIELAAWEHLVDRNQYETIADIMVYLLKKSYLGRPLPAMLFQALKDIEMAGLDVINYRKEFGWRYYTEVRAQDIAAAINRLRSLTTTVKS